MSEPVVAMSYARVTEEQVLVLRWGVSCPEHGELLWGVRSREEAEDKRFAHNSAHHPSSAEATLSRVFPADPDPDFPTDKETPDE